MALVRTKYCNECEKETMHRNEKCEVCGEREERERRIAKWNSHLRIRLERLESGPPRY